MSTFSSECEKVSDLFKKADAMKKKDKEGLNEEEEERKEP